MHGPVTISKDLKELKFLQLTKLYKTLVALHENVNE